MEKACNKSAKDRVIKEHEEMIAWHEAELNGEHRDKEETDNRSESDRLGIEDNINSESNGLLTEDDASKLYDSHANKMEELRKNYK